MRPPSMSRRMNSNSVPDAAGKPTSICLNPQRTSASNSSSFCATFIGTASAWLPSRRSTLHQMGACVSVCAGQRRSGKSIGGKGRYFERGSKDMVVEKPGGGEKERSRSHSPGKRGTRPETKQDRSPRATRGQSRACSGREHRKSAGQQETHVGRSLAAAGEKSMLAKRAR